MWLPTLYLRDGGFSDIGYRFRYNIFNMTDSWIPGMPGTSDTFFDLVFFNSDTLPALPRSKYIASIYYRIDIN